MQYEKQKYQFDERDMFWAAKRKTFGAMKLRTFDRKLYRPCMIVAASHAHYKLRTENRKVSREPIRALRLLKTFWKTSPPSSQRSSLGMWVCGRWFGLSGGRVTRMLDPSYLTLYWTTVCVKMQLYN